MSREDEASQLRGKAMEIQLSSPCEALDLLNRAVTEYRDTWTVANLVVDDIIGIATYNGLWDEAIEACALAQDLKPDYRESYVLEAQACRLDKEGAHIEALEVRLRGATLHGKWSGTLDHYASQFAQLGEHDRAWGLWNEAAILAIKERRGSHSIRKNMAELLLKEGKPNAAVELLITGICEAEKLKGETPKALASALKKALRASGFNLRQEAFRELPDEIIVVCKTKGRQEAVALFYERKQQV